MAPEALLLDIEGMKCGGCVSAVEKRLRAQPGVQEASVNLLSRSAWVELEPPATAESLLESLAALGFPGHLRDPDGELERLQQELAFITNYTLYRVKFDFFGFFHKREIFV